MGTPPDTEGAEFQAVAPPSRRAPAIVALAALAVVAVALLTRSPAPAVSAPTAEATPRATAAVAPSLQPPAVAPRPAATSGPPARNPTVTPHPSSVTVVAAAGETELIPAGTDSVRLAITLPDGWSRSGDAAFAKANGPGPAGVSIGAWRLEHVYAFPCRWSSQAFADAALLGTAQGQAVALSSWWGQDPTMPPKSNAGIAPIATRPQPATIQGYPAWYVEVLIPSGFDLTQCDGGQLVLWDTADDKVRSSLGPAELSRLWVVDVGGEPIIIEASSVRASSAELAELQAVVDSVVFEP